MLYDLPQEGYIVLHQVLNRLFFVKRFAVREPDLQAVMDNRTMGAHYKGSPAFAAMGGAHGP